MCCVFIGFGPLAGGAAGDRERSLKSSHFVAPLCWSGTRLAWLCGLGTERVSPRSSPILAKLGSRRRSPRPAEILGDEARGLGGNGAEALADGDACGCRQPEPLALLLGRFHVPI